MNFKTNYDDRSALKSNVFMGDAKLAFSGLGASSSFKLSGVIGFHVFVHFEVSMLSYAAVTPRVQCATVLRGKNI